MEIVAGTRRAEIGASGPTALQSRADGAQGLRDI
jgi:hypothetical protein